MKATERPEIQELADKLLNSGWGPISDNNWENLAKLYDLGEIQMHTSQWYIQTLDNLREDYKKLKESINSIWVPITGEEVSWDGIAFSDINNDDSEYDSGISPGRFKINYIIDNQNEKNEQKFYLIHGIWTNIKHISQI